MLKFVNSNEFENNDKYVLKNMYYDQLDTLIFKIMCE